MTVEEFRASVTGTEPPQALSVPLTALWWDAKGDWARAHGLVDELDSMDGMAVHAYLHRKEGDASNAGVLVPAGGAEVLSREVRRRVGGIGGGVGGMRLRL